MPAIQRVNIPPCRSRLAGDGIHKIAIASKPAPTRGVMRCLGDFGKSCPNVYNLGQPSPLTYAAIQRFRFWSILWVVVFY
ncbi:hypothetical protein FBY04_101131 [Pseudomonas sp. SJZ080]|nr:hypothetical protein FBY04_101131 [Pseudomonas sp. SJZ080]